jgi:hypothetical protein
MSLYSGMTITVTAQAFDRVTKLPISNPTCVFNFYAPPKDPEYNPSDRVVDYTCTGTFDPDQNKYTGVITTTGWTGGKWHYQGVLSESPYSAWEYSSFILKP